MSDAGPSAKLALRRVLRERRRDFVGELGDGRAAAESAIATHALVLLADAACVAVYAAIGGEVDPASLLAALTARGVATALPFSTTREAPPSFRRWVPGDPLVPGPFGTLQPDADAREALPDAIIAPLLGFDRERHRLGAGAGWYDRALAAAPDARRIGLAWSIQAVDALPCDPWDIALEAIVTERGVR